MLLGSVRSYDERCEAARTQSDLSRTTIPRGVRRRARFCEYNTNDITSYVGIVLRTDKLKYYYYYYNYYCY